MNNIATFLTFVAGIFMISACYELYYEDKIEMLTSICFATLLQVTSLTLRKNK